MRDGAIVACLVVAVAHLFGLLSIGVDAYAYWTVDPSSPYGASAPGTFRAFFYSPAFAQLTAPIHLLPWQVFIAIWTVVLTLVLLWQTAAGSRSRFCSFRSSSISPSPTSIS